MGPRVAGWTLAFLPAGYGAFLVGGTGALLEWWSGVPIVALVGSAALDAAMLRGTRDSGDRDSE